MVHAIVRTIKWRLAFSEVNNQIYDVTITITF